MNEGEFGSFNPFNPIQQKTSHHTKTHTSPHTLHDELHQLKSENRLLRDKIHNLERDNKMKDQLLHEKSTRIVMCTSENQRLKYQIVILKKQLHLAKHHKNSHTKRNKKKLKRRQLLPLTKGSSYGSSSDEEDPQIMPYLVPQISISMSASSNLSEQACTVSFPAVQDTNPAQINKLSPIAEHPNDESGSLSIPTLVPQIAVTSHTTQLVEISDDNDNILRDEWGDCMAALDMDDADEDQGSNHLNVYGLHANNDCHSDEESRSGSPSPSPSFLSNETDKLLENNMRTHGVVFSEDDSDDMVSYMSDNTMMMIDMSYHRLMSTKEMDLELSQKSSQHYAVNGKNGSNQCDVVIQSPLNLLGSQKDCNLVL
eukprot:77977_1